MLNVMRRKMELFGKLARELRALPTPDFSEVYDRHADEIPITAIAPNNTAPILNPARCRLAADIDVQNVGAFIVPHP
jgi:hypothetical protein